MADTLKFGPEWLRALSDGGSVGTPPPSPAAGFGKYKLAEYRYGREEMLALFTPDSKVPENLQTLTSILVEKPQEPLALLPLSDEEQRIISQSVNSTAVLRMMGRGAPPMRGGRGGGVVDRGRGRGRGRGDGYIQRGMSYEDGESGGFGRPKGFARSDGWEEAGAKRYDHSYSRFEDTGNQPVRKDFQRSLSSDNWRERDENDDDGDWRRAGSKWNTRANWREAGRGEFDRSKPNNLQQRGPGGFDRNRQYQRSRSSESWDEEEMPEWSISEQGDLEELGTFDSSGAFVSNKVKRKSSKEDNFSPEECPPGLGKENEMKSPETAEKRKKEKEKEDSPRQSVQPVNNKVEKNKGANIEENKRQSKPESAKTEEISSQVQRSKKKEGETEKQKVTEKSSSSHKNSKDAMDIKPEIVTQKNTPPNKSATTKSGKGGKDNSALSEKDKSMSTNSALQSEKKVPNGMVKESKSPPALNSKGGSKKVSEAETLDQLKETAENMVAGITVMEDDAEKHGSPPSQQQSQALPAEHENSMKWFYRDPQGDLQGPFLSSEMAQWFSAGYFTMNLLVKRGCDEKFSPLGELIKHWGRVPFLPGPSPPPLMNSPQPSPDVTQQQAAQQAAQQEQLQAFQQQMLIQQQLFQQQMLMRHIQWQQIQQMMVQLQDNEHFKALPIMQQQQYAMQMLLKQSPPFIPPQSQSQTKLSPRTPPSEAAAAGSPPMSHPAFVRSMSQPADVSHGQNEENSVWGGVSPAAAGVGSQPVSIWDLEPNKPQMLPAELEAQLKILKEKEEAELRKKLEAEERKRQEELERQQNELRKQQEEIQRQKEEMEREKVELERQRQLELQRIEEARRKEEEERLRQEENQRRQAEEKRRMEEEERKRQELEKQRQEEMRKQEMERKRQEELRKQQEAQRQQEMERQQEAQRLKEQELERQEMERRQEQARQQEIQRQQQEALRKLQQEQMANMQLPSHAQWASAQSGTPSSQSGLSLMEIQQQEEEKRERDEMQRRQLEAQRQQQLLQQQQQQQQQQPRTWSAQLPGGQSNNRAKSLLEIQEEQARQLEQERKNMEQNQQQTIKNMTVNQAGVWGSSPSSSNWASEGAWGNALRANTINMQSNNSSSGSLGFWDDAIISTSSSAPSSKKQSSKSAKSSSDFPALGGGTNIHKAPPVNKVKTITKTRKEEEAVQRLFQTTKPEDDFTQWCEGRLRSMATSVDIPTFIAFLQEVESPYEVHDYIRSYLGENKATTDFAKQFLEKRSQYRNKSKPVHEDSIWGPAPALTPREYRQQQHSNDHDNQKNKGNKKKKRMMKVDSSILGFTVHAAPDRVNVGEIDEAAPLGSTSAR